MGFEVSPKPKHSRIPPYFRSVSLQPQLGAGSLLRCPGPSSGNSKGWTLPKESSLEEEGEALSDISRPLFSFILEFP